MTRIITHQGCLDGFHSAFIAKQYLLPFLKIDTNNIEIIPANPTEIELDQIELQPTDFVLDLPKPKRPVFFWADHHPTSKPRAPIANQTTSQEQILKIPITHEMWRDNASCTGLLIDYLTQNNYPLPKEVYLLKETLDKTDTASYTPKEYEDCFIEPNFTNPTLLQQTIIISTTFQTKDAVLNNILFTHILKEPQGPIPTLSPYYNNPYLKFLALAHFQNMKEWREIMNTIFEENSEASCVIQDDRKLTIRRGVVDRFYVYYKFKDAKYSINLRDHDDGTTRIGIGKNVFYYKDQPIDIGQLCKTVGKKFGSGSGGGHKDVGGCSVLKENANDALNFILNEIKTALHKKE